MRTYLQLQPELKRLYRTSVKNALRRDIPFELSKEDFAVICDRSDGRCELSKVEFDHTKSADKWARRPWAASLDRIQHTEGYNAKNCRLLCVAVNIALNTWGIDVLLTVARGVLGLSQPSHPRRNGKLLGLTRTSSGSFRVRAFVGGKLQEIGSFRSHEAALAAYYKAKTQPDLAPDLAPETQLCGGEGGIRTLLAPEAKAPCLL